MSCTALRSSCPRPTSEDRKQLVAAEALPTFPASIAHYVYITRIRAAQAQDPAIPALDYSPHMHMTEYVPDDREAPGPPVQQDVPPAAMQSPDHRRRRRGSAPRGAAPCNVPPPAAPSPAAPIPAFDPVAAGARRLGPGGGAPGLSSSLERYVAKTKDVAMRELQDRVAFLQREAVRRRPAPAAAPIPLAIQLSDSQFKLMMQRQGPASPPPAAQAPQAAPAPLTNKLDKFMEFLCSCL